MFHPEIVMTLMQVLMMMTTTTTQPMVLRGGAQQPTRIWFASLPPSFPVRRAANGSRL